MAVAVNPTNPLNLVAAAIAPADNDNCGDNRKQINTFSTLDGGATWRRVPIQTWLPDPAPAPVPCPPAGADPIFRTDPSVVFDRNGNAYVGFGAHPNLSSNPRGTVMVCRSTDGGQTYPPAACGRVVDLADKWYIATGPDPTDPARTNLYVTAVDWDGNVLLWRSADVASGFPNFGRSVRVNWRSGDSRQFAQPAVGPHGEVYVSWHERHTGRIFVARSRNGGSSFDPEVLVATSNADLILHRFPLAPHRGIHVGPVIDVDRSGGAFNGRVYVAYVANRVGVTAAQPFGDDLSFDVYVRHSSDNGATWSSTEVRASDDPAAQRHSHFLPWLTVDQATGTVAVVWYDNRFAPVDPADPHHHSVNVMLGLSTDGGVSFDAVPNQRVSDHASNMHTPSFPPGFGDFAEYIGAAAWACNVHVVWTDNSQNWTDAPPTPTRPDNALFADRLRAPCPGTRYWVGGSGSWTDAQAWAPAAGAAGGIGPPGGQATIYLTPSDAADRTVSYRNPAGASTPYTRLTIDATGGGAMLLAQSQDDLFVGSAAIGVSGRGRVEQSAGTNTIVDWVIGNNPGSSGAYVLGGGASLRSAALMLGVNGNASFVQNGGDFRLLRQLLIGFAPAGSGRYELHSGSLAANEQFIGNKGRGTFIQRGGLNSVAAISPTAGGRGGTLEIASEAGSVGLYDLGGGRLEALRILNRGSLLYSGGSLKARVDNSGLFTVGGDRQLDGGLAQTGTGVLGFKVAAGLADRLRLTGNLDLAGRIDVTLGGTEPVVGESFELLSAAEIRGYSPYLFRLAGLSGVRKLKPLLSSDGRSIRVEVISLDLDGSGGIDCADWSLVRKALGRRAGQSGFDARADINGDALIDVRDLSAIAQKLAAGQRCS